MAISTGTQLHPLPRFGSAVLVVCAIIAAYRLLQQDNVPSWAWWVSGAMLIPWCAMFGYVAITGRAPQWFVYTRSKDGRSDGNL